MIRSRPERPYLPGLGNMKVETNVPIADSADDRDGETPAQRSSTPLDFPGLTDDQAWATMVKYARMIDRSDNNYEVFCENSNAFVGAMLAAVGGDPLAMLPTGISRSEAPGVANYDDLMADVPHLPTVSCAALQGLTGSPVIKSTRCSSLAREVTPFGAGAVTIRSMAAWVMICC